MWFRISRHKNKINQSDGNKMDEKIQIFMSNLSIWIISRSANFKIIVEIKILNFPSKKVRRKEIRKRKRFWCKLFNFQPQKLIIIKIKHLVNFLCNYTLSLIFLIFNYQSEPKQSLADCIEVYILICNLNLCITTLYW